MTVGNSLKYFFTQPFPELHHPFLVTGGQKWRRLHEKVSKKFMSTISTFDPRKAIMEDAAIKIAVKELCHIGDEEGLLSVINRVDPPSYGFPTE